MPSARSRRQPTIRRTPVALAASWARTMPARLLRSTIASASMPSSAACANNSSQELAPRRNEKCEVHLQLGVARGAHPKIPCRNQRCEPVAGVLAVAGAIDPEALAGLVLDLEIVAHRDQLGVALPPFAEDALGAVGALHAAADAAPGEGDGRMIGQQRDGLDRLRVSAAGATAAASGSGQPSPVSGAAGATRAHRAFRHVARDRSEAIEPLFADAIGERVDQVGDIGLRLLRSARRSPVSGASGSASVAARLMISMPKPGSIGLDLVAEQAASDASRRAPAAPCRCGSPRCGCRRDESSRSSRRAPRPLASSASQS